MSGTHSEVRTRGNGLALVGTALPAAFVLGLFVIYIVVVPGSKRTFDHFGLTLPWLTQLVIRVSNWVSENWWMTLPVLGIFAAGNFLLVRWLSQRAGVIAILWVITMSVVLVAIIAVTLYSLELPMARLREGLAR